jgi:hypothetical protein
MSIRFFSRAQALAGVLATAGFVLAAPATAAPTGLDMNSLSPSLVGGQLTEGFVLSSQGGFAFVGNSGNCAPVCANNGSNYVWSGDAVISLKAADGSSFVFNQFDGAETHVGQPLLWANAIQVMGQYAAGGSVSAQFVLDGVNDGTGPLTDFQTFILPTSFAGLSSISFQVAGTQTGQFALDNILLNTSAASSGSSGTNSSGAPVNGIPEAGSLALVLAALVLAGASLHRTRKRKTSMSGPRF